MKSIGRLVAVLIATLIPGILPSFFPFLQTADADQIASYSLEKRKDGVRILFSKPMAVDLVNISAVHSAIWGPGRQASVAIARTASRSAVCGLHPGETGFAFRIFDPETLSIEIEPLLTRESSIPYREELLIEGTSASRYRVESDLERLSIDTTEWQDRKKCFCCHRVLPLALSASEARVKGLRLPLSALLSLAEKIVSWQKVDGSFSFSEAPVYGVVTPTLCAAAVLAWIRFISPRVEPALLRAVTFLVSLQQPDGSVIPDFTFPPLMTGRPFAVWLLGHSLSEMSGLLEERGYSSIPRLNWSLQRVRSWFQDTSSLRSPSPAGARLAEGKDNGQIQGQDRFFFALLEDPDRLLRNPSSLEGARSQVLEFQRSLDPDRDSELFVLAELLQRRLGGAAGHFVSRPDFDSGRFKKAAWFLLAEILQEP